MVYQSPTTETVAIADVSLGVKPGEFVSIVGPSGCGKSTLLDIICSLVTPTRGTVRMNSRVGYMLQRDHLLEWRSILQNCMLGPELQGHNLKEAREYVNHLLRAYGLHDFTNHYPRQLSGGMRQRAALIRTLAVKPDVLLLDEPFSSLDYQTRLAVADEVWTILQKEGKTAILVTHDIAEAISMADRVVVLTARPASVKKTIPIVMTSEGPPLMRRQDERFREYFDMIWKELDIHVSMV
ncbi:MAG: ABC transporter ATP-binding protein [Bacillota bacterium]|nr:ABC transporter ATP-binding protein [Bacillota bacterium]